MSHRNKIQTAVVLAVLLGQLVSAQTARGKERVVDASYTARNGGRVIAQSLVLDLPVGRVWDLYTSAKGLESWAAPRAEVDLRIGGSITSNFKVGAKLGEPGTVVTEIINLIPEREISLRDDLVDLLTMGGLFEWLDLFPATFLAELKSAGDDVFTTTRFEPLPESRTRVTVFSYGYREGEQWDRVYASTKESNLWFLANLSKRVEKGPIDWSETP